MLGLARTKLFRYKTHSTMTIRSTDLRNKATGRRKVALSDPRPASYPFSAIVGQDEMKLALMLNVIDPLIGGVLIMGHRGTGKRSQSFPVVRIVVIQELNKTSAKNAKPRLPQVRSYKLNARKSQ